MTADARRDEALRLIDEAIAEAHEAFVAVGGDWKRAGMGVYSQVSVLQSRRVAALDDGNQIPQHVADFIAYHDPATMLRLHRANKAIIEAAQKARREHDSQEPGSLHRLVLADRADALEAAADLIVAAYLSGAPVG